MTDAVPPDPESTDQTLDHLVERVADLTRVIARQAGALDRLTDEAKARAKQDRAGADLPLVVELSGLHADAQACAATAESPKEQAAFTAFAARLERVIVGRGGALVQPAPGTPFDSLTMEAGDVTATADPDADRTVDSLIMAGLTVAGRSVRPASVVVRRYAR